MPASGGDSADRPAVDHLVDHLGDSAEDRGDDQVGSEAGYQNGSLDPMPELPIDSDVEVLDGASGLVVPPHLRPGYLAVVAVGGAFGTVARYLITNAVVPALSQPAITMIINLVGSLLLGVLLEALAFRGPDTGVRRRLRLLLGTGVLGGFTTYSTLSLDVATFIAQGRLWSALGYGLGSAALGVVAAAFGVWLALISHRRLGRPAVQR